MPKLDIYDCFQFVLSLIQVVFQYFRKGQNLVYSIGKASIAETAAMRRRRSAAKLHRPGDTSQRDDATWLPWKLPLCCCVVVVAVSGGKCLSESRLYRFGGYGGKTCKCQSRLHSIFKTENKYYIEWSSSSPSRRFALNKDVFICKMRISTAPRFSTAYAYDQHGETDFWMISVWHWISWSRWSCTPQWTTGDILCGFNRAENGCCFGESLTYKPQANYIPWPQINHKERTPS